MGVSRRRLWGYYPPEPFTDILDVMKDTGFYRHSRDRFPRQPTRYGVTKAQMQSEVSKRGLHVVTISWNGSWQIRRARQASWTVRGLR